MKTLLLGALLVTLCGCGSDGASNSYEADLKYTDAGNYQSSSRNSAGAWEVTTSAAVFGTYSSFHVPLNSPVTTKEYLHPDDGRSMGTLLVCGGEYLLIRE